MRSADMRKSHTQDIACFENPGELSRQRAWGREGQNENGEGSTQGGS